MLNRPLPSLVVSTFIYIIATVSNAAVAFFVPPVFAMCDCLYSTVKSFLIFPLSLLTGAISLFLYRVASKKISRTLSLLVSFVLIWIIISGINIFLFKTNLPSPFGRKIPPPILKYEN